MTRLAHDCPRLEAWFKDARGVAHAERQSDSEIAKLRQSLQQLPTPDPGAHLALLKFASIAAIGGAALGAIAIHESFSANPILESQGPTPSRAPMSQPIPPPSHQGSLPPRMESEVSVAEPIHPSSPLRPRAAVAQPSWKDVRNALERGRTSEAEVFLMALAQQGPRASREKAQLSLAELEMRAGKPSDAQARLERLAKSAIDPSVRRRATSLLSREKLHPGAKNQD